MAKNESTGKGSRNGAARDRSQVSSPRGASVKRDSGTGRFIHQKPDGGAFKGVRREILFPTEPTVIGDKKIDRAVERVISRKN